MYAHGFINVNVFIHNVQVIARSEHVCHRFITSDKVLQPCLCDTQPILHLWLAILVIILVARFFQFFFRRLLDTLRISNVKNLVFIADTDLISQRRFRRKHVTPVIRLLYQCECMRCMVVTVYFKFIPGKIARVEVDFGFHICNHILCCHPVRFLFIEVEREIIIYELQDVARHNGINRSRERRLYIIEVLAPLKNAVFRHHFGFLNV